MDKDTLSLIINGVLAAGTLAAYVFHQIDLPTTIALLGAESLPGAGNVLLGRLADALQSKEPK